MFKNSLFKNHSDYINVFSRISDPLVVVFAAIMAYGVRFSFSDLDVPKNYHSLILFVVLNVILVFPLFNMYSSWRGQSLARQSRAVILAWFSVVLIMIVILFGLKISDDYSRLWLAWWMLLGLVFLLSFRMSIYGFLKYRRSQGKNFRRIVIVGAGDLGKRLIAQTDSSLWAGFKINGLFDDDKKYRGSIVSGHNVLGDLSQVGSYVEKEDIDEVWIALPLRAERRVKELLYELRHQTVNIKFIPDIFGFSLLNHSLTEVVGVPAVNLSGTPMGGSNSLIKGIEDRLLALLICVIISPLLLFIALAIKFTSSGAVLFKQKRHGWDGRIIKVYKFRTMKVHSDFDGEITQACKGDSRITPFGSFLRRTSLDELPQFFNVLQGRMSIVGPRPHAVEHNELYKDQVNQYMLRHMVKPGITGWAQINGLRGETDTLDKMKKRVEYDLFYIENWSLWFDLKIIFMTIFKGFINKNAY